MKPRTVLFLSTQGVDVHCDALNFANDDWAPDRPALAAFAVRLAAVAERSDGRSHSHG